MSIQTVQQLYAAFGRGDIPAILSELADAVEWDAEVPDRGVPWLRPRHGREQVAEFFGTLAGLEFHRFEPVSFLEGPNQVAAVIDIDVTVRATGRRIAERELHLWTFDERGKVGRFRHYVDTQAHLEACRGA